MLRDIMTGSIVTGALVMLVAVVYSLPLLRRLCHHGHSQAVATTRVLVAEILEPDWPKPPELDHPGARRQLEARSLYRALGDTGEWPAVADPHPDYVPRHIADDDTPVYLSKPMAQRLRKAVNLAYNEVAYEAARTAREALLVFEVGRLRRLVEQETGWWQRHTEELERMRPKPLRVARYLEPVLLVPELRALEPPRLQLAGVGAG